MFQQPFCIYENLSFFCVGGPLVLGCYFSKDGKYTPARVSLPCDPPCDYVGVAFSKESKILLAIDHLSRRLILSSIECCDDQHEINIINPKQSPRTATYAYGKFWLTLLEGDFETKLAYIDNEKNDLHIFEIQSKWEQGELNLIGYPLLMNCHEQLVLYNPLTNTLYWLKEDCTVKKYTELHPKSVLGQTGSGDLLVLENNNNNYSLSRIDLQGKTVLYSNFQSPCDVIVGIAVHSNGIIIVLSDDNLVYYSRCNNIWEKLSIPTPTLLWEAYMEQG